MTTIVTRAVKGSPLTITEMDSNFTNLNTDLVAVRDGSFTVPNATTATTATTVSNGAITVAKLASATAGTNLIAKSTNVVANTTVTPIKSNEIRIGIAGTYTVTMSGHSQNPAFGFGRIYKNGVAFGTIQTFTNTGASQQFSENLAFAAGDLIQLYIWTSSTNMTSEYLQVAEANPITPYVTL